MIYDNPLKSKVHDTNIPNPFCSILSKKTNGYIVGYQQIGYTPQPS